LGFRFAIGFLNTNFDDSYGKFYAKQVSSSIDYDNLKLNENGFPVSTDVFKNFELVPCTPDIYTTDPKKPLEKLLF